MKDFEIADKLMEMGYAIISRRKGLVARIEESDNTVFEGKEDVFRRYKSKDTITIPLNIARYIKNSDRVLFGYRKKPESFRGLDSVLDMQIKPTTQMPYPEPQAILKAANERVERMNKRQSFFSVKFFACSAVSLAFLVWLSAIGFFIQHSINGW